MDIIDQDRSPCNTEVDAEARPWVILDCHEPTDAERHECAEQFGAWDARDDPDRDETLTLEELVRVQADSYAGWHNDAGDLLASTLLGLADRIRFVRAACPADLEAREDVLDDDVDTYRRNCRGPITRDQAKAALADAWARLVR